MIRKVVDRVHEIVNANFNSDFATLAAAASVPAVTADIYKRWSADRFKLHTSAGVGVYHDGGGTSRRRPGSPAGAGRRDSRIEVVLDWYIKGDNEDETMVQTELAVDALLRSIDRLVPDETRLVWGAGDARESINWVITRTPQSTESRVAEERAIVRVPVTVRDEGL